MMAKTKARENGKAWLQKEMRPYNGGIFFITVLTCFSTLFSLAFAYMTRYLINSASDGKKTLLVVFSAVLLGLLLLRIAIQTLSGYLAEKLRAKITAQQRTKLFSKILRSDYAKIQGYHSGELINRLTTDIQEVAVDTVGLLPAVVGMAIQCVGAIIALMTLNPYFTCLYVVCGAIFGGLTAVFRKQIKKRQKEVLQADGQSRSFMQESISSVMTLKAYSAERKTTDKAQGFTDAYYQARMRRNTLRSGMSALFSLLSNFGLILAIVLCSVSILVQGNDDYGSMLSMILLLMQLQHPFSAFSSVIPAYYSRLASAERLSEIEDIAVEQTSDNAANINALYLDMQSILVDNVYFAYDRDAIFSGASTIIHKGEIACLTGASGTGKSTLFRLLLQVYEPTDGAIYIRMQTDDIPLTAKMRGLFAYVPQGNFLFSGTIYENLTFFCEDLGANADEKIKAALQTACAEFVWDLPQGLQTVLGEDGDGLSEGQTQRLAVARAILSNRPILLLDEATSALDSETEKKLLENIRALQNKTCLIVTHRPAALEIADKILTVENHKIV